MKQIQQAPQPQALIVMCDVGREFRIGAFILHLNYWQIHVVVDMREV